MTCAQSQSKILTWITFAFCVRVRASRFHLPKKATVAARRVVSTFANWRGNYGKETLHCEIAVGKSPYHK